MNVGVGVQLRYNSHTTAAVERTKKRKSEKKKKVEKLKKKKKKPLMGLRIKRCRRILKTSKKRMRYNSDLDLI